MDNQRPYISAIRLKIFNKESRRREKYSACFHLGKTHSNYSLLHLWWVTKPELKIQVFCSVEAKCSDM